MFTKVVPDDYYLSHNISSFTNFSSSSIDYNTEIYQRNPIVKNKLTLNHIEFIEFFVRLIKPKNFLELGVQFAECTKAIIDLIPEYYGVDINMSSNIEYIIKSYPSFKFFHGTTDDFFASRTANMNLEMAFIDACHSHEASYQDFLHIKDHIVDDGIIFFHDTYPASEYWTQNDLCHDCYRTSKLIRLHHHREWEILTIPINPGISIARKCKKQLKWLNKTTSN
jgi:predicted O-methyltransferase YrrM